MKLVDYEEIQVGDVVRLERIEHYDEVIEGEILKKFHAEWNNIISGNKSNNPKDWVMERYISPDYILELNGYTNMGEHKGKLIKIMIGSKWYKCYTYQK